MRSHRWAALALLTAVSAAPASAQQAEANQRRFAVIVGTRAGALGRASLQYAHDDARAVASALTDVAHFRRSDVQLLLEPEPGEVLRALDRARDQAAGQPGAMLLFYYSGHADDRALYPGGKRLEFAELRSRLDAGAALRLGIIDACRGGGWTGAKGLSATEPFEVRLPLSPDSEGSILLSSSSGQENAHEAEAIGGSIFTHHLVAGMRGAADANLDGEVSVVEVFGYARELTVRDSAVLTPTPQHPSFSFNLRGRDDLILSRTAASSARVLIRQTQGPLVILDRRSGHDLMELPSGERNVEVALPPGRYLALRRRDGETYAREFKVSADQQFRLEESSLLPAPHLASASKGIPPGPRYTVTLEPALTPLGIIPLEVERAFTDHVSGYLNPVLWIPPNPQSVWAAELNVGARYFFFGEAPSGLFAATQVNAMMGFEHGLAGFATAVSIHGGYSLLLWDRFVVSLSGGPQYLLPIWNREGAPNPAAILPRVRFTLGAAF